MEHITDDEAEETFKDFEEFRSMQDNNMYGVEQDSDDKVIKVNAKTTTEESGRGGKMITVSEADERKVKETVSSSNFTSDPVSLEENSVSDRDDVVSYKEELGKDKNCEDS
jgi:nicotinic acid phosphoribosyltransferase